MGLIVSVFMLGLLPFTLFYVLLRGYYALEDTRTPFWITVVFSVVLLALAVPAVRYRAARRRHAGRRDRPGLLARRTGSASCVAWWVLARRLGSMESGRTAWVIARVFVAGGDRGGRHGGGARPVRVHAADRRSTVTWQVRGSLLVSVVRHVGRRAGGLPGRGVGDARPGGRRRTVAGAPDGRARAEARRAGMRATEQLGRYRLLDLVTQDAGAGGHEDVYLWHGLRRGPRPAGGHPGAVRRRSRGPRPSSAPPRPPPASTTADCCACSTSSTCRPPRPTRPGSRSSASGRADATSSAPSRTGTARRFAAPEALTLVAEVARAIAAGARENVSHGRLRPSSVFITDAGEVRIRGLAVDAALFGRPPDRPSADRQPRPTSTRSAAWSTCSRPATGRATPPMAAPAAPRNGRGGPAAVAGAGRGPAQRRRRRRAIRGHGGPAAGRGPGARRRPPSPPWSAPPSTTSPRCPRPRSAPPPPRAAGASGPCWSCSGASSPSSSRPPWSRASPGSAGSCSPAVRTPRRTTRPP